MSKQHYVRVEPGTPREKGDVRWCYQTCKLLPVYQHIGKHVYTNDFVLRPVDPEPVNPWIKGSDRLPSREDATENGYVWVYREDKDYPQVLGRGSVAPSHHWRPIDQTPPPSEPTEAELVEELLKAVEAFQCSGKIQECAQAIRAKQESEGRDV